MRTYVDALVDFYTPRPSEMEECDRAYARLDAISGVINVKPTHPIPGEMPHSYRKRLLKEVLPHSAKFRHMNIAGLGGDTLDVMEGEIYADAVATANDPMSVPPGQTRTIRYRDEANRLITKTVGQTPTWMDHFITDGAVCTIRRSK